MDSGNLTINGGSVIATGGIDAPGLGSCGGKSGVITVNGGRVNATGGHVHNTDTHGAPGIGANDRPGTGTGIIPGTMEHIYFYGGETTAYRGAGNYPPIGDSRNPTGGDIHLADGMKTEKAKLENGKLTNYYLGYVIVKPETNAGPAYTVGTACDETKGSVTTSLPMARADQEISFTATPKEGCHLVSVTVTKYGGEDVPVTEGTSVTEGTFTMPSASSVTVNAQFKTDAHAVTIDELTHGTITADKTTVNMGSNVTLTVTPEQGYTLKEGSLKVTDSEKHPIVVSTDESGKPVFTMPDNDVTVTAQFVAQQQTLMAFLNGAEYGSYTVAVNGEVKEVSTETGTQSFNVKTGDTIIVTFKPADNGRIEKFYTENQTGRETNRIGNIKDNVCTFSMPGETTSISTEFAYNNIIEEVSYIDENGDTQTAEATVLTGLEPEKRRDQSTGFYFYTALGNDSEETWYVVKEGKTVNYDHASFGRNLVLSGDVHIIVADGATLSVQGEITDSSLSVYGQTKGTGKIVADKVKTYTINVCGAELGTGPISANIINVKNGKLTVDGDVSCSSLAITSGVTNIKGIASVDTELILGCADENDRIMVRQYDEMPDNDSVTATVQGSQTLVVDADGDERTFSSDIKELLLGMGNLTLRGYFGGHAHNFSYTAEGATITATCSAANCPLEHNRATLTIAAPADLTYDGDGDPKAARVTVTGATIDDTGVWGGTPAIIYASTDGTTYGPSEEAPANAGEYTASITLQEQTASVTASVDYVIEKAASTITTPPTASPITYGTKLSDIELGGEGEPEGHFEWEDGTLVPAVSDSGTTEYAVVFFPVDTNYATAECQVTLTVAPREVKLSWSDAPLTFNGESQVPAATIDNKVVGDDDIGVSVTVEGEHIDADEYTATVALTGEKAGNYTLPTADQTKTFRIEKAEGKSWDVQMTLYNTASSISASAIGKMPEDAGEVKYYAGEATQTGSVTVPDFTVGERSGDVTAAISGGAAGDTITLPVTITSTNYNNSTVNVKVTLTAPPAFGTPDFTLPQNLTGIEANAFEGIAATAVDIPAGCTSIGACAFKECPNLNRIRIPAGCSLGEDVFAGCGRQIYIYGTEESDAQRYCETHENFVFVPVK